MHPHFSWLNHHIIENLIRILSYEDHIFKFVGGCVRDSIINDIEKSSKTTDIKSIDFDIASNFTPEENIIQLKKQNAYIIPTGLSHGTITLILEGVSFQITSLRTDKKTDGRHAIVSYGKDFFEDAKRRDFTFNALYLCPKTYEISDYFNGIEHLKAGKVEFIGEPLKRIQEDYLRILRFFRFFALYGKVAPDDFTLEVIKNEAKNLVFLSKERISQEFEKLILAKDPSLALKLMSTTDIFKHTVNFSTNSIANFKDFMNLEEKFNLKSKNLRFAYLIENESETSLNNIVIKKADLKEIRNIISLKKFINHYKVVEFNEFCELLSYYPYENIVKALLCIATDNQNLKFHYLGLIEKILQKSKLSFPINGEDIISSGIKEGLEIAKTLQKLRKIFWQQDLESPNIINKDFYMGIIKKTLQ